MKHKVTAEELNSLPGKRIIAIKNLNEPEEGICQFCGERMIWRDLGEQHEVTAGHYNQTDNGGLWDHKCDRKKLQKRELGLIDFIQTNARINGMSSMVEHPRYQELIDLQDKLYRPEEE